MYQIIYIVLMLVVASQAQVPFIGGCPRNVVSKQNFNGAAYLGKWYEQEKYFAIFQLGGKCVTANYGSVSANSISVLNKQLNIITNQPTQISGTATFTGATNVGSLSVVFPTVPFQIPAPYNILDTDYTTYAVVYSCNDFILFHTKFVWLLTRDANPSVAVMNNAFRVLDVNGISRAYLLRTDQTNCPAGN